MDKVIRILVANRPRVMRELLLATLADRPDIVTVKRTAPYWLVSSLDELGQRAKICDTVLRAHPELRSVAVATEHNRSVCYWASLQLDIHCSDIEPSQEGILSVMRNIAGAGGVA
jgi:hypothetical protein